MNKVLFFAPHTDDVELGCGGTLSKLLREGHEVFVVAFSTARQTLNSNNKDEDQLKKEFHLAMDVYNIPLKNRYVYDFQVRRLSYHRQEVLDVMIKLRSEIDPDWVFIPSSSDCHQDHQVVHNEGVRAFKSCTLWGYELPWNHFSYDAHAFVELNTQDLEVKLSALQRYKSQIDKDRNYFQKDFILGLAKVRGVQAGLEYAESFEIMRVIY